MSEQIFENIANLVLSGVAIEVALSVAFRPQHEDHKVIRMIVPFAGAPIAIPSAACVRARLAGIASPSREDIVKALHDCSG